MAKRKKPTCTESASGRHHRASTAYAGSDRYCMWCSHDMGPKRSRKKRRADGGKETNG